MTDVLARHAENPSAFLAMNEQTEHFVLPEVDGFIAYRPAGRRHLIQFGDAFAPAEDRVRLLRSFLSFASDSRQKVVGVQLTHADAELYAQNGFRVNQLGANYARALDGFNLTGRKFVQLRNKISRAKRAGIVATEITGPESTRETMCRLADVDRKWLAGKGRHVKELSFMVGELGGALQPMRRLFVASDGTGAIVGYISFSPVYGSRSGWLHDLSRRDPDAPPGVLELLVTTAVEQFRAERAGTLHFGFTPFTSLDPKNEVTGYSNLVAGALRLLAERGSAIYPAASQLAYKEKWALDQIQPEYVAFQGRVSVGALWGLLRLTNSV